MLCHPLTGERILQIEPGQGLSPSTRLGDDSHSPILGKCSLEPTNQFGWHHGAFCLLFLPREVLSYPLFVHSLPLVRILLNSHPHTGLARLQRKLWGGFSPGRQTLGGQRTPSTFSPTLDQSPQFPIYEIGGNRIKVLLSQFQCFRRQET